MNHRHAHKIACAAHVRMVGSCPVCEAQTLVRRMNRLWVAAFVASAMVMLMGSFAQAANWNYPQTVAANETAAASIRTPTPYFTISSNEVGQAVAEQLTAQGLVDKKVSASVNPGTPPVLYSADHPIKVVIQALQVDTQAKRWQAQAFIVGEKATETVRPVAGRYETIVNVPVLKKQFSATDVIEASDIALREIPERQLRKDTITETSQLVGKSPLRQITADRPVRLSEIALPTLIKKGQMVEMSYTTERMTIRDQGIALEDGAQGKAIRVKNSKTGRAVTAYVAGEGKVETNSGAM